MTEKIKRKGRKKNHQERKEKRGGMKMTLGNIWKEIEKKIIRK